MLAPAHSPAHSFAAGGRTERLVNPIAWDRGMVIVQCGECKVWHKIADAANLVVEVRYADLAAEEAEAKAGRAEISDDE